MKAANQFWLRYVPSKRVKLGTALSTFSAVRNLFVPPTALAVHVHLMSAFPHRKSVTDVAA
ncbi:hypothetical protein [Phyllobacterium sp. SB3]|uniref:hypothetical protein n=1 Tax=Phyllobacterium sp. SB3 TaxID=3156073 RepID=UPI0032AF8659